MKDPVNNEEYSSKSERVNDLIYQATKQQAQFDYIRTIIEKSEESGFTYDTKAQILKQLKFKFNCEL